MMNSSIKSEMAEFKVGVQLSIQSSDDSQEDVRALLGFVPDPKEPAFTLCTTKIRLTALLASMFDFLVRITACPALAPCFLLVVISIVDESS